MVRRKLKTINSRPKAPFGSQEAAILGAAAINVAGQMAAAGISSKATSDAAKQQAQATINAATRQANALKDQTNKSKELQEHSIEFTKEQNAENRELQKDIQLNLQMLTGQQNVNDRLDAAKIQVRNGGRMSMKSTNGQDDIILRGSYSPTNMPFVVTDGGGVVPVGVTPEGFDMYEIKGNDHEHYHKTKSGKHKTGVGFKFANGKVIEGEGNQNGNQGEYVLVTPTDAMFISRHSIKGFNPAKAVNNGMNPLMAFMMQEQIKNANGISDSGKTNKRMIGGLTYNNSPFATQVPDLSRDGMAPIATGVAYGSINDMYSKDNKAKNGTSVRKKLACGGRHKAEAGAWSNWAGAGINALGNLGGAWIIQDGSKRAANLMADANMQAAGVLADAYRQMHGIDMNLINKNDYVAVHSMPAIRAAIVNTNAQTAAEDRALQRRLTNSKRYSMSGAAAQDRMSIAETEYNDNINRIESEANRIRESIKQENAQRITQVANENANRDTQANERYNAARLSLLQYNNDIENQKIAGIGQANADAITQSSIAKAQGLQTGANAFSSALSASTQGFTSVANGLMTERANRENILINADSRNKVDYLIANTKTAGNKRQAYNLWNTWKNSSNSNLKQYANELASAYNFS